MTKEKDTYKYKGWLNSDCFIKRALAVFWYSTAGYFILFFIFFIFTLITMILVNILDFFIKVNG